MLEATGEGVLSSGFWVLSWNAECGMMNEMWEDEVASFKFQVSGFKFAWKGDGEQLHARLAGRARQARQGGFAARSLL